MSEMVKRAAVAAAAAPVGAASEASEVRWGRIARAALLAALDPEDEALIEAVAQKLDMRIDDMPESRALARRALIALKAFAQGGSVE